jgi:hypothetical protein
MLRRCLLAVLLAVFALPLLAQNSATPDFTGTWVLNLAKSTLGDDTTKSETLEIANKKSTIVFHYKRDGKKSTDTYTPDGQDRVVQNMSSGQLISRARWQGMTLVIESTLKINMPNATLIYKGGRPITDTWTLSADGRTLTLQPNDPKEVFVYDKQ